MAPEQASSYFPTLDWCLDGGIQLFSWKTTFAELSHLSPASKQGRLRRHLTDRETIKILSSWLFPYPRPTKETKADFETRTSAINVTPTTPRRYNIEEIKGDALWLSQTLEIDEISSLRIVILEWQNRSALQISEVPTQLDPSVVFLNNSNGSLNQPLGYGNLAASRSSQTATSEESDTIRTRRVRLILIYLSEKRYLLRVFDFINFHADYEASAKEGIDPSSLKDDENWVERLSYDVFQAFRERQLQKQDRVNPWHHAIAALEHRARSLPRKDGFMKDGEPELDLEIAWNTNQIVEMIHIMQILIFHNEARPIVTPSNYIVGWFKFMSECKFFEQIDLSTFGVDPAYIIPFQANVALLSLSILQITPSLRLLEESSDSPHSIADSTDIAPYLLNPVAICEINDSLLEAAGEGYCNASPAVFAWSIILQTLREFANASKQDRELLQSDRSASTYISANPSVGDGEELIGRRRPSPQRRVSAGSDMSQQSTFLEDILERVTNVATNEDSIAFLAKSAISFTRVLDIISSLAVEFCGPFGAGHKGKVGMKLRLVLLSLLRAASEYIDYDVDLIAAILAVLISPSRYQDVPEQHKRHRDAEPCSVFLNDTLLMHKVFGTALCRFPYETLTFLKLSRALAACKCSLDEGAKPLRSILEDMKTYTCAMPAEIDIREQWENDEAIDSPFCELATDFDAFQSNSDLGKTFKSLTGNHNPNLMSISGGASTFRIPSGTKGRVLANGHSFVVIWYHQYPCLTYLGKLLEQACTSKDRYREHTRITTMEMASEVIGLITTMLTSATDLKETEDGSNQEISSILEQASHGLDGDQDIVTTVFRIFEEELYKQQFQQGGEPVSELLLQCVQFTRTLLHILPGRVWPFLGRSGLLGLDGKESQLSAIVTGVEMAAGQYGFLLGCIRLFDALVEDALVNVVPRRTSKAATRFEVQKPVGTGVSDVTMKRILLAFERVIVDVFETCRNWKFASQEESLDVNMRVCLTLDKVLRYSFEVDDNPDPSKKLTSSLASAAENLIEVFLSKSTGDLSVQPLLHLFVEGLATPQEEVSTELLENWRAQTRAALNFSCTLVQLARFLNRPLGRLEELLFDSAPTLVKLYAVEESYRLPAIELLERLTYSMGIREEKPQSLLTRLGESTAKNFIETLSALDQPGDNTLLARAIWKFLTTAISQRQQWFAVYLLTGDTPRASFQSKDCSSGAHTISTRPLAQIALERLVEIERIQPDEAVNMLEFVTAAADCWPGVVFDTRQNTQDVCHAFADYIASKDTWQKRGPQETGEDAVRKQVASLVLRFLAIVVNYQRVKRVDNPYVKKLKPKLEYLLSNAVKAPDYNNSLHQKLSSNFGRKFPSCQLLNFKRTLLKQWRLGDDYYFNIERARKMLGKDDGWAGKVRQSYEEEFRRANINLSAVEAQVMLLKSWCPLVVEMSLSLNEDVDFHDKLVEVVRGSLEANQHNLVPEHIFERMAQTRADLAFTLSQRIIEISPSTDQARSILLPAWQTIHAKAPNLGPALIGEDAEYTRTLLKILYVALQPHARVPVEERPFESKKAKPSHTRSPTNVDTILEIVKTVAAEGFRSLTTLLHEDPTKVFPIDFALITAILRTCLHIPSITDHPVHLVTAFSDDRTAQYASTLLSWSDQLTINNNDPVYGEISILYLLELSAVPALAESIAVDGILNQISTAKLMGYFSRQGGIGPFQEPLRMHAIWSKGILPLTLNLIKAIGAPIVGEIVAFLNAFSPQITRSLQNLLIAGSSNPSSDSRRNNNNNNSNSPPAGYITLNISSEMQSLALLTSIIDTFRDAGPSVGINANDVPALKLDKQQMREDLMALLQRRTALRECIVATSEREEGLGKAEPRDRASGAENRLEERVVEELGAALAVLGGGEGLSI